MFAFISGGYHLLDKFFTMDYNAILLKWCEEHLHTSKRLLKSYEDRNGVETCDKTNFPRFVVGYEFYLSRCVFYIPLQRLGDITHTTRWMKIISNHKPWEILYLYNCKCCQLGLIVQHVPETKFSKASKVYFFSKSRIII